MLIRTYGLYWRRENVFWGRQKNSGHLKGTFASGKKTGPVDFREQQGIYTLYDDGFNLVYAGQAGVKNQRLFTRIKTHTTDHLADRWSRFSWFGVRWVLKSNKLSKENEAAHPNLSDVLNHIEAVLIAAAEPPHNRQGGRFGEKVQQYLQYTDVENLGPSLAEMMKELYKKERGEGVQNSVSQG